MQPWQDVRRAMEHLVAADPDDAGAHERLGIALFWLDEPERSFDLRERAYKLLIDGGDRRGAARVAMKIALDIADFRGIAVSSGWLQCARRLLENEEVCAEHGWLALWEGHWARFDHDLEKAKSQARQAKSLARTMRIHDLELFVIALEGLINVTEGRVRDGMRQLDEATAAALAGELSDIDAVLATCCLLAHACERVSDWERAAQWNVKIDSLARRWNMTSAYAGCQAEHAASLIGLGEWDRAETELQAALKTLEAKRPLIAHEAVVQLGELRRRQGRTAEAVELFNRHPNISESIIGLAAIALDRGDALRAADMLERLHRRPLAEKWVQRAVILELLVRARIAMEDAGGAANAATTLRELAQRVAIPMVMALSKRADARIASDVARARADFEDAIDLFETCPAPWEVAQTRIELAKVLREMGRHSFAAEEEAAARATLSRLGVTKPEAGSTPLTKRELEVLSLVAKGMSDKEVALKLRLSEHTVHRHVSNVLAKLALPSRAAAVATAAARGWMA